MSLPDGRFQFPDLEEIYRKSPTELKREAEVQKQTYLARIPSTLRPLGERLYVERDLASDIALRRTRIRENPGNEPDSAVESSLLQADEEYRFCKERIAALEADLRAKRIELIISNAPADSQHEIRALIGEWSRLIKSYIEPSFAGRVGAIGGRSFNLMRQIDEARAAGQVYRVEILIRELEEVKQAYRSAEQEVEESYKVIEPRLKGIKERLRKICPECLENAELLQ